MSDKEESTPVPIAKDDPVIEKKEETEEVPATTTTTAEKGKEEDEEAPLPSLPKRPLSPLSQLQKELGDAFPDLDSKLITAILILSQGELDQSFNALLYYNDPSTLSDEEVRSLFKPQLPVRQEQTQLQKDEELLRQLAKKYSKREGRLQNERSKSKSYNDYLLRENNESGDSDTFEKFLENDLPQFKQQFNKNIEETSTKISSWFGNLNKKLSESSSNQPLFSAIGGANNNNNNNQKTSPEYRNSSSRARYDYDDESIINQTSGISLNDNTATGEDIYGTPLKKNSFDSTKEKTKISNIKPEPIETGTKKNEVKKEEEKKDGGDDDFLVDDSDEE